MAHRLAEIASQSKLIAVGFDAYQIRFFELELQRLGITLPLIAHPQGTLKSTETMLWMPRSIELTEKRLFEKTIRIQRNPCLWWNAQCAAIETDRHQNRTFSKKRSRGAIDGVVALAMAIGTSQAEVKEPPRYQLIFV